MYRVNYGNGQVSNQTPRKWEAQRDAEREGGSAFVEFYHVGTADDPGDWFPLSSTVATARIWIDHRDAWRMLADLADNAIRARVDHGTVTFHPEVGPTVYAADPVAGDCDGAAYCCACVDKSNRTGVPELPSVHPLWPAEIDEDSSCCHCGAHLPSVPTDDEPKPRSSVDETAHYRAC